MDGTNHRMMISLLDSSSTASDDTAATSSNEDNIGSEAIPERVDIVHRVCAETFVS